MKFPELLKMLKDFLERRQGIVTVSRLANEVCMDRTSVYHILKHGKAVFTSWNRLALATIRLEFFILREEQPTNRNPNKRWELS